jgi:hypothetical protein
MKFFFDPSNYNYNKAFEKYISKILVFIYSYLISMVVITLDFKNEKDLDIMENIITIFDEFCGLFFTFKSVKIINDFHEFVLR